MSKWPPSMEHTCIPWLLLQNESCIICFGPFSVSESLVVPCLFLTFKLEFLFFTIFTVFYLILVQQFGNLVVFKKCYINKVDWTEVDCSYRPLFNLFYLLTGVSCSAQRPRGSDDGLYRLSWHKTKPTRELNYINKEPESRVCRHYQTAEGLLGEREGGV